jgi:hypothetical protein
MMRERTRKPKEKEVPHKKGNIECERDKLKKESENF